MSLWLKGAIEERGCEREGCVDCPYQVFDENNYACEMEGSWAKLYTAVDLWSLLGENDRAKKLEYLLKENIGQKFLELDLEEDEDRFPCITISEIKVIISLIEGLDTALYAITDKH